MKYTKINPNAVNEKNMKEWKWEPKKKWGEYVVDDSKFVPMSELVKRTATAAGSGNDRTGLMYDFENGKDTGMKIPFSRTRDGKGIVELSKHIYEQKQKLGKQKQEALKNAAAEISAEMKIKELTE